MQNFNIPTAVPQIMGGLQTFVQATEEARARDKQQAALAEGAQLLQSGNPDAVATWSLNNPGLVQHFTQAANLQDQIASKPRIQVAKDILVGRVNPREGYEARANEIESRGGDAAQLRGALENKSDEELREMALMDLAVLDSKAFNNFSKSTGQDSRGASRKSYAPITIVNPDTKEKKLVAPTYNPKTNKAELSPFDMPEGFEISRETAEEKRAADVIAKGEGKQAEVRAKSQEEREQGYIDSGVEAADSMGGVVRAIELLDLVETGGFDAAALRAKQLFGIESADEGELANQLGIAVLAQLKPIFGSAFTSEEGKRLERLSAGFGKSPAANKRILEQQLKIAERAARRAIRAATKRGDEFTVEEIESALERARSATDGNEPNQLQGDDKEAYDWAKQNPNDPRSAQILQKLGIK